MKDNNVLMSSQALFSFGIFVFKMWSSGAIARTAWIGPMRCRCSWGWRSWTSSSRLSNSTTRTTSWPGEIYIQQSSIYRSKVMLVGMHLWGGNLRLLIYSGYVPNYRLMKKFWRDQAKTGLSSSIKIDWLIDWLARSEGSKSLYNDHLSIDRSIYLHIYKVSP